MSKSLQKAFRDICLIHNEHLLISSGKEIAIRRCPENSSRAQSLDKREMYLVYMARHTVLVECFISRHYHCMEQRQPP